jgi:hypothetical protein
MGKKLYERVCRHCGAINTFYHGEKLEFCSSCGENDYIKPETETKLFLLQKQWTETRDKKILGDMYVILTKYVQSKIKKILNGKVIYDDDKLEEKATDAVNMLIEYYLTKEDFYIQTSFMGYVQHQIRSTLYNKSTRFADNVESLNYVIGDNNRELIDTIVIEPLYENSLNNAFMIQETDEDDLINGVLNILEGINTRIRTNHGHSMSILALVGTYHYMKRATDFYKNKFYDMYGRNILKDFVENTMMLIHKFIKDN